MTTVTVKALREGEEQVVHLPPEMAYEDDIDLEVTRSGDVVTLRPAERTKPKRTFQEMLERLQTMPRPPSVEKWNDEDIADRPGV